MGRQIKPDVRLLIKRIKESASLPESKNKIATKFSREQLAELYIYIKELKKSQSELYIKVEKMHILNSQLQGKLNEKSN